MDEVSELSIGSGLCTQFLFCCKCANAIFLKNSSRMRYAKYPVNVAGSTSSVNYGLPDIFTEMHIMRRDKKEEEEGNDFFCFTCLCTVI